MNIILLQGAESDPATATMLGEIVNADAVPRVGDIIALPEGYYHVLSVLWDYVHVDGPQQVSVNMKFLGELPQETLQ